MLLQKEKQSIEEIGKKDKKIYERRKVSLSNIYDLLFPQKSLSAPLFGERLRREVWQ